MAVKDVLKNWFGGGLLGGNPYAIRPDEEGMYPIYTQWGISPQFNDYTADIEKINAIFRNPALLKVFCLQCDLFSLGRINVLNAAGVEQSADPLYNLIRNPNPMQFGSQFLWDMMFNIMLGNAYCYVDSNIATNVDNKLYFLETNKIEWPTELTRKKDKMVFSKQAYAELMATVIKYRYESGEAIEFPLSKLICITDLSNGQGNWFKGKSRIDALHKLVSNSEALLDAININVRLSGKFMVAGQADPKKVDQLMMGEEEKRSIEEKVNGRKNVHAVKSMIDIKRFVENMRYLQLDEHYRSTYFFIGSMYNIPKDVLEAYLTGATFENQEKATSRHISYTLQPKGDDFFGALGQRFGYTERGLYISISWSHLPFMQVFAKDKAQVDNQNAQTATALLKIGATVQEINDLLGTNFKTLKYEQPKATAPVAVAGPTA